LPNSYFENGLNKYVETYGKPKGYDLSDLRLSLGGYGKITEWGRYHLVNDIPGIKRFEAARSLMKAGYDIFENSGLCRHLKGKINKFSYHVCCAHPLLARSIYQPLGMIRSGDEYTLPVLLSFNQEVKPLKFIPLLLNLNRTDERVHNNEFDTYKSEEYQVRKSTYLFLGSRHFKIYDRMKFFFWYLVKNTFSGKKSILDFRDIKFSFLDLILGCDCKQSDRAGVPTLVRE